MRKLSLIRYFTIFSAIAFIITGTVLGFFISNHIKNDKLKNVKDITRSTLNACLKSELTPEDFEKPLSKDKISMLNLKFEQIIQSSDIIGINIWDKHGNILYSDNPDLIGQHFVIGEELEEALCNNSQLSISRPNKAENKDFMSNYSEIVELYEPITFNGTVAGVFEVYIPYDEIKQHMTILNRTIAFIMFLGLLILYFFLLKIIYDASRTLVLQNQSLTEQKMKLEESYQKLNSTYKNTIATLSSAVDARDTYTAGHSERVAEISSKIGKKLGLSENQLEKLELAALFHDIGKLGIPDEILHKPGRLTDEEYKIIKFHPQIGVNILKNIEFLNDVLPIILHHHESFSGSGYPTGLKTSDIPLEARIIALSDTYDAMTSDRPYRKSLSHEAAVSEIIKFKELQFDPVIVEAFLKIEKQINKNADSLAHYM